MVAVVGFEPTPLEILSFSPLPVGLHSRLLSIYSITTPVVVVNTGG